MQPVLKAATNGEVRISDVVASLADQFQLTAAERAQMLPSGRITLFANRVHWAKTYLKQAQLVEPTRRAHFKITDRGVAALRSGEKIDNRYLAQFPEFQDFKVRSRDDEGADVQPAAVTPEPTTTATPDEIMGAAYRRINDQLRDDLLDRVRELSPAFFEKLIVELLVSMGFGGGAESAGKALGQSGDGGVDGVIDQDALGLDRVYIQAKRYGPANKIGASAIRDFFGSLDRFKAAKGVFVTTSDFTSDAEQTAEYLSKRIVLINGNRLGDLMIMHGVGCRTEQVLQIKKVDEDFFTE